MAVAIHLDLAESAAALLDRHDISHGRILDADSDSILFLGPGGVGAYTAWLHETRVVMVEVGFSADPPEGLHDSRVNYGRAGGTLPRF